MMLLIYPPIAKNSEPPPGIAQLTGTLQQHNIPCDIIDFNLESIYFLLHRDNPSNDTWTRRAKKNTKRNIEAIQDIATYRNPSRYRKSVFELNRLLETQAWPGLNISMTNYQDRVLSPLSSEDLLHMAHNHKDTIFYPLFLDKLSTSFQKKQPDHIGLSLNYLSQALSCFALIGTIRELLPQAKIIVGGGLISSWMRSGNWNNPFAGLIDHCIEGCGANFLLSLFGKLPGTEAPSFYEDFDRKRYLSPGFILPYSTSSGCFWNKCNFCPERAEGNLFQIKTPDRVSRELTDLTNTYKPTLLHLLDNAIPPVILQRIISDNRRIPWYGFIRVTDQLLDPDFCKALKTSGCVMLKLGIESGSQLVLDQMEKGISLHKVSRALKNLKVAGIHTYVYLLFGTPAETHEKALQTLRFTVDHQSEISFLNLAIFNMPTNSQERSSVKTSSFSRSDLSLYTDFEHPNGWNRREVRSFLDREFKRTAAISQILRRDPPFFTSNHAPFLCNGSFAQPSKPPTP